MLGIVSIGLYALALGGAGERLGRSMTERLGRERMREVIVARDSLAEPLSSAAPAAAKPLLRPEPLSGGAYLPLAEQLPAEAAPPPYDMREQIQETTIMGGLSINNATSYSVDAAEILQGGPGLSLDAGRPQILIIHTHSSEAYTQAGLDRYQPSDSCRTEDTQFNVVRIGDELTEIFQQAGLEVIHDRGIYDYPSYTGSYSRSGKAVEQYLKDSPSIKIVLDIHRDALASGDVVYKTMAEEEGEVASQLMLLAGSDESGLEHPGWRQNLALALYLQNAAISQHPTLMRPVSLVRERYNQQLSPGSLILEVGSNGNTLREALAGIRLFGQAVAPALLRLVKADPGAI